MTEEIRMTVSRAWKSIKQYLIIVPGFGIGLLVWFWLDMIGGYPLWVGMSLAISVCMVYEVLACKYELHISNVKKIVTIAFVTGIVVAGTTFALGSGEFIKEFHVKIVCQNNWNKTVLLMVYTEGAGEGLCVKPGETVRGGGISIFSTWCVPQGICHMEVIVYNGCTIPSPDNIYKKKDFLLPLYGDETDITFIVTLDEKGDISVGRQ